MQSIQISEKDKSFLKKVVPVAAFVGGLCCFTPVVLVLLGLSTVSFAASLSDVLYYQYRWAFRGVALLLLFSAVGWYLYKKEGICTLDQVKRNRRKIINLLLVAFVVGVLAYIIWLYVIVEIIGLMLGIWGL